MGVPKFFRYVSERYPCLSEVIKEHQIPEFDNLYLDMNGIFHVCSHPNDNDAHFRITEEQIFKGIFHYLEVLFRLIRPKKLFFMAVDGVAPRAKMNQQRGRRFRSVKESEMLEKKALSRGEKLPEGKRFDSNCITPGTEFMAKLDRQLNYFVSYKISTDKLWRRPKIILSGHQVPGEGEHKVMDYVRWMRSQKDWDPNTKHCLYGLDADLIMLGLCTHEPNFCLLREEASTYLNKIDTLVVVGTWMGDRPQRGFTTMVKFGRKSQKRVPTPEETTFLLFHLSLLRDYLDLEFQELKTTLPFKYDLERIIDDWVLMCFLVGNDFIPNLPGLNIADGALQLLYKTYISVLPSLGGGYLVSDGIVFWGREGYINDGGTLNLSNFEGYLRKLAEYDLDQFREIQADIKYFETKTGRKILQEGMDDVDNSMVNYRSDTMNEELQDLINSTKLELENGDGAEEDSGEESDEDTSKDEDEEEELLHAEFLQYKKDYYMNKLAYGQVTPEVLTSQAEGYVRAIQWNLHYYYNGCPSWSWYYPHHYSPYISDIKGFADLKIDFELGHPFLPFQQLLAVLPAGSKEFLPRSLQNLMTCTDSPLIDFYPKDFEIDMNGKKQEWEGIVLIPFIDQDSLLKAMEPCYTDFTEEERIRNTHGPMYIYQYTSEDLGQMEAPEYFPKISSNHARAEEVWSAEIVVDRKNLVKGLHPRYKLMYHPGFPTLNRIPFKAALRKEKVKVFEQPSRGENMILTLTSFDQRDLREIAEDIVGKVVYVGWPHLTKAIVSHISSTKECYTYNAESKKPVLTTPPNSEVVVWNMAKTGILARHRSQMGIDIGHVKVLVFACPIKGKRIKFQNDSVPYYDIIWNETPLAFPLQTIVTDVGETTEDAEEDKVPTRSEEESKTDGKKTPEPSRKQLCLDDIFQPGTTCFMIAPPFYGARGEIIDCKKEGRVKTCLCIKSCPDISSVRMLSTYHKKRYMSGSYAASTLALSPHLWSRITGTIFIQSANTDSDKTNIGLNLKFNKRNELLLGFTRKENNQWFYSEECIKIVREYMEKFPKVFEYLNNNTGDDIFFKEDVFTSNATEQLKEISSWLKEQSHYAAERRHVGAEMIESEAIAELEYIVSSYKDPVIRKVTVQVRPNLIYLPKPFLDTVGPDPSVKHHLLDRIVSVRECHTIPLGLKGTIIVMTIVMTSISIPEDGGGPNGVVVRMPDHHAIGPGFDFLRGIDKKDDEASTLYDILFDEPFVGGLKLGGCKETRCYRLTQHGFINLSVHSSLSLGNQQQKQQAQQSQKQWRTQPNAEMPLSVQISSASEMDSGSRNNSAFANWRNKDAPNSHNNNRQQQHQSQQQQQQPMGPTPVSAFFKAYHQNTRKEAGGSGGASKPGQPQPPPLVPQAFLQKPTADVEFQDMWKVLQSQKLETAKLAAKPQQAQKSNPEPQESIPAQVSQIVYLTPHHFFFLPPWQQTDALKKFLKLDTTTTPCLRPDVPVQQPPKKACGHKNCCLSLVSLCQKMGIAYPVYDYSVNPGTNLITTTVRFPGVVREFIGTPEKEKASAAENAACVAVQMLIHSQQMVGAGMQPSLHHHHPLHQPVPPPPFFQQPPPPGFNQQPPPPQVQYRFIKNYSATGGPDGVVVRMPDCHAIGPGFDSLRLQSWLKARLASRPLGVYRSCNMNQNLPTPPQQWYKHNKMDGNQIRLKTREPNQSRPANLLFAQQPPPNTNRGTGSNSSLSQFVPLQVQKGGSGNKVGKQGGGAPAQPAQQRKNKSGAQQQQQQQSNPTSPQKKQNSQAQAKVADMVSRRDHNVVKLIEGQVGLTSEREHHGAQDKKRQPPKPAQEVGGEETPASGPNQPAQGSGQKRKARLRPRIAAKFPVPLDTA
ncbi:hypothetical protein AAG570_004928 [Ranatra chinensis]|uniref:Uncharacterized protein n=1 Tax=Ranatra chinensis TaxID=642074 RepID=A0ABD0Y1H0_9HEMI